MGAGAFPSGLGLSGFDPFFPPIEPPNKGLDPVQSYPSSQAVQTPLVLSYSPTVLGFVQNADGSLQGVHVVDQEVALAVFIEYGSISSAPTVGSRFRVVLNRVPPQRIKSIAKNELNRCLAALIATNSIKLLAFAVDASTPGRILMGIAYTNLKDPRYNPNNPALAGRTLSGTIGA